MTIGVKVKRYGTKCFRDTGAECKKEKNDEAA